MLLLPCHGLQECSTKAPDSVRSSPMPLCCLQEGFLAQDDAGAHEAYERELDEEEAIKRLDAEAAARCADGAAHAASNGSTGASSHAAAAGGSAGEPRFLMLHYSYSTMKLCLTCHCLQQTLCLPLSLLLHCGHVRKALICSYPCSRGGQQYGSQSGSRGC